MTRIRDWKIGARLGAGFALVLALMAVMAGSVFVSLSGIGASTRTLADEVLVKAEAAATLDATTRANARRTMELFFARDDAERQRILDHIETNKATVKGALDLLDRLVHLPQGRAILDRILPLRAAYVASLSRVSAQLASGDRVGAEAQLRDVTLPTLDRLQAEVGALSRFQKELADRDAQGIVGHVDQARGVLLLVGLVCLVVGVAAAWWLTRSIIRPLREAVTVARTVAQGDLSSTITVRSRDETGELLHALHEMNDALVRIVTQVREGSESIATGTSQIATGNSDLSARTEEQASSLEQTAASMEQLTHTVQANADTAQEASRLALGATEAVGEGSRAVGDAITTMDAISQASRRIAEITGLIDGIAFQTNILALNAAVEAARAGEAGRGFAVVASEVRTLAQRSAEAAREIKALIAESETRVSTGARQVESAGRCMDGIVGQVRRVSALVAEISGSSQQQSLGIAQVGEAVAQLDRVTQQNAALVEQSAAAADSLRQQADGLAQAVRAFRLAPGGLTVNAAA